MDEQQSNAGVPLSIFISYAHEDEPLCQQLEAHLSLLRRQGLVATWYDRQIVPGTEWAREIDAHLETAQLVLLLISPDFLASEYCYGIEMRRALGRYQNGEAQVIPIIVRPVDWEGAPFAHLQCLPRDAPGGGASLNLTTVHENMKPGTMKLYLSTPDIEAAYKELKAKGVEPTSEITDDGWGKWFGMSDPDGNKWLIVQS